MSDKLVQTIKAANTSLNSSLEGLKTDVRKSHNLLEKVIGFFTQIQSTIEDGVSRLLQNQSMMLLVSKTSELESFRDLLGEQQAVLEQKKEYLIQDLKKLQDRYDKLNTELTESTNGTISKIDGHVINLSKDYYEDGPGSFYGNYSAPLVGRERQYFTDCFLYRQESVEEEAYKACEVIDDFLVSREKFVADIRSFISDTVEPEAISKSIPVILAEFSKDNQKVVVGPGKATYYQSEVNLVLDGELEEVIDTLEGQIETMNAKLAYRDLTIAEREDWKHMIDKLFESGLVKDTKLVSLKQALLDCIDSTTIKVGERNIG
ncbi:MAG: hypothetical protein DRZ90_06510 [Spirochaetes bacterium]|nr:MAG: hypothetical protein DRZ90_06510 [Spirochaetota bacterium]